MSSYWAEFGKTSNPNYKGAAVRWPEWKGRRRWGRHTGARVANRQSMYRFGA
jgi:hypothetical protein